jgi:poly(beta-D-mannuronate) lyase
MTSLVLAAAPPQTGKLRSPWDSAKVTPTNVAYACPAPPPFARTVDVQPYYTDKHASVIDPQKLAAFQKGSEAPTHLGQFAGAAADAYLSKGSRDAAVCVYTLLDAAAKAEAWTGKMPFQGVYLQNWELSGVAIPYLKVRQSGVGTPEQEARIQKWFRLLAARVTEFFDAEVRRIGPDNENNHLYWAGLAVAAQGIADDDRKAFHWGMVAFDMGLDEIQADGSLPQEMGRGQMALHYHLYALGPLIMLAELGEANGLDLYSHDDGAIHRLVKFCVASIEDPTTIEKRTGVTQQVPHPLGGSDIGWGVPYVHRFPNAELSALIARAEWTRFWQWGGAPPDQGAETSRQDGAKR